MIGGTTILIGHAQVVPTRAHSPGPSSKNGPKWKKFVRFRFSPKWVGVKKFTYILPGPRNCPYTFLLYKSKNLFFNIIFLEK